MSSTRSIARRAAALGASISLVALGVLAASPAQAATCTVTPTTWPDLQSAFATAPATGAVICLGADITAPQSFVPGADRLSQPNGSNVTFDLNARSLTIAVDPSSGIDAGIAVDAGNTLTIDATGGGAITISGGSYGAAIGASSSSDLGTVIINGGVIDVSTAIDGAESAARSSRPPRLTAPSPSTVAPSPPRRTTADRNRRRRVQHHCGRHHDHRRRDQRAGTCGSPVSEAPRKIRPSAETSPSPAA